MISHWYYNLCNIGIFACVMLFPMLKYALLRWLHIVFCARFTFDSVYVAWNVTLTWKWATTGHGIVFILRALLGNDVIVNISSYLLFQMSLGSTAHSTEIGHLVLQYLCPAVQAVLGDGLKPYTRSVFGQVSYGHSEWCVFSVLLVPLCVWQAEFI